MNSYFTSHSEQLTKYPMAQLYVRWYFNSYLVIRPFSAFHAYISVTNLQEIFCRADVFYEQSNLIWSFVSYMHTNGPLLQVKYPGFQEKSQPRLGKDDRKLRDPRRNC